MKDGALLFDKLHEMMLTTGSGRPEVGEMSWNVRQSYTLEVALATSKSDLVPAAPTLSITYHVLQWATKEAPA